ncbi:MAG: AIR carboxylase family protein [Candidatus Gracilibacteria bacterium]
MRAGDNSIPVVAVVTGSDSDFEKLRSCTDAIEATGIGVLRRIISAHRRPDALADFARNLPDILLPENIQNSIGDSKLKVLVAIFAAGCSAHIAGAAAAQTQMPVIALPVASSACGTLDAFLAMINMPPGIPNGFAPSNEVAAAMASKLCQLKLEAGYNGVAVSESCIGFIDTALCEKLGLVIDHDSPIVLDIQNIDQPTRFTNIPTEKIRIIIPVMGQQLTYENIACLKNVDQEALYMRLQLAGGKVETSNAMIFAAQILAQHNPEISERLQQYRAGLGQALKEKDETLMVSEIMRIVSTS